MILLIEDKPCRALLLTSGLMLWMKKWNPCMTMTFGILFAYLKDWNLLVVNGSLKLRGTQKVIKKDIRHVLLQRDLLNVKASIIMKHFSSVSLKDSFRFIMALLAHFDLKLHQMGVKIAFLNGEIDGIIYMEQPENFVTRDSESMVRKLKKSLYGLKQSPRLWYHKFHTLHPVLWWILLMNVYIISLVGASICF